MRSAPGRIGTVVSTHINSEGELATIERCTGGAFEGRPLLCLYDDDTPVVAPILLDDDTRKWLVREVVHLDHDGSTFIEAAVDGVLSGYLDIELAKKLHADRGDLASDLADLFRALMVAQGVRP